MTERGLRLFNFFDPSKELKRLKSRSPRRTNAYRLDNLMKQCAHCGRFNYDTATDCRECGAALPVLLQTVAKSPWMGPEKAKVLRSRALSFVVLGLLMMVYWGGHGPWTAVDNPTLQGLRTWLEPLFLYGGAAVYLAGWVLSFV